MHLCYKNAENDGGLGFRSNKQMKDKTGQTTHFSNCDTQLKTIIVLPMSHLVLGDMFFANVQLELKVPVMLPANLAIKV